MKKLLVVVSVICGLMMCTPAAFAADKFAYVDLSRLFAEYGKTKDFDKILTAKEEAYTAERDKKIAEVKALQEKLNLLSDKEKTAKQGEMETKVRSLQEFDRQKQTDLRKEQDEKMKEILKDIETAVKQFAEKEGYTMVFNDRVLVYQVKNLDITDSVMTILNKNTPAPAAKK
jgi:outer membrane protein